MHATSWVRCNYRWNSYRKEVNEAQGHFRRWRIYLHILLHAETEAQFSRVLIECVLKISVKHGSHVRANGCCAVGVRGSEKRGFPFRKLQRMFTVGHQADAVDFNLRYLGVLVDLNEAKRSARCMRRGVCLYHGDHSHAITEIWNAQVVVEKEFQLQDTLPAIVSCCTD